MKRKSTSPLLRVVAFLLAVASPVGIWWLAKPQSAKGLTKEQLKDYGVDPSRFCPDESDYYDFRSSRSTWIFRGKCRPQVAKAWLENQQLQEGLHLSVPASGTPFPSPLIGADEPALQYTILYDNGVPQNPPTRLVWIGYNEETGDWYFMSSLR